MTGADDLAAWLTRIWDEQEALAKAAPGCEWVAFKMEDVAGASVYDEQWVLLYPQHYDHDNPLSKEPDATGPMYITRARDELVAHVAANDPASVLARIAADRKILAEYIARDEDVDLMLGPDRPRQREWSGLRLAVRLLAQPYAEWPGYREEWKP